jgi:uncharacterized membrane protein YfcA
VISTALLVALSLFCGGLVKGIFGMGLPTVALGLLSLTMPPVEAATLIIVPTLATNAWQFATGPQSAALAGRFAILLLGVGIGTVLGVGFLTGSHTALVSIALGGVLILYAVVGMISTRLHVSTRAEPWASPLVGLATGIVNGATGVSVITSGSPPRARRRWRLLRYSPGCTPDSSFDCACMAMRIASGFSSD